MAHVAPLGALRPLQETSMRIALSLAALLFSAAALAEGNPFDRDTYRQGPFRYPWEKK